MIKPDGKGTYRVEFTITGFATVQGDSHEKVFDKVTDMSAQELLDISIDDDVQVDSIEKN